MASQYGLYDLAVRGTQKKCPHEQLFRPGQAVLFVLGSFRPDRRELPKLNRVPRNIPTNNHVIIKEIQVIWVNTGRQPDRHFFNGPEV